MRQFHFSWLFIFTITLHLFYSSVYYPLAKNKHRSHQYATMHEEHNMRLVLSPLEFMHAKVDDKEFILNNQWYDIQHIEYQADFIVVFCVQDIKESLLIELFHKLFHKSKSAHEQLLSLITTYLVHSSIINFIMPTDYRTIYYASVSLINSSFITSIEQPPDVNG